LSIFLQYIFVRHVHLPPANPLKKPPSPHWLKDNSLLIGLIFQGLSRFRQITPTAWVIERAGLNVALATRLPNSRWNVTFFQTPAAETIS
jgi:hypothetical protein